MANQRLYLLQQLKCQGLSRNALHIIFTAIVLSVVTYALPAFSGQLSKGDRDRLDGLFRKAFIRGLCFDVFHIDDLMRDADKKLFREASDHRHCLHPLLPKQRPKKLLSSLRCRGHSYTLPHIEFSLYKNSFINRCLFDMI